MKSFAVTLGALATFVAAQEISGLPECGQFCATDMLNGQAAGIGCEANDLQCLCQSPDFMYGLRDCSGATCGPDDARRIIEYGVQICRDAGVEITAGPTGNPTATGTDGGNESTDGTDGAGGAVSTILTTVSSDGEAVTTTPIATTTIGAGVTTATEGGSNTPSETPGASDTSGAGGLVSTITTDGTTLVTTLSTVTSSEGGSETETSTGGDSTNTEDGGSASTTESDGAAMPQRTMAPAGILAAGLAALLL